MVTIEAVKNPRLNEFGQVECDVRIRVGDGVGTKPEWVQYSATRGDVASTGNEVWRRLCEGDFTCDDGFELNFDPSELIPDDLPEEH